MTRKDYTIIADTLRATYANIPGASIEFYEAQCRTFAIVLRRDNSRFCTDKFLKACGIEI